MGEIAKHEIKRSKTRADDLEVFETGFYRVRDVFECKGAGGNEVGSRKSIYLSKRQKL